MTITDLDACTLSRIFYYLDVRSIESAACVCKVWNKATESIRQYTGKIFKGDYTVEVKNFTPGYHSSQFTSKTIQRILCGCSTPYLIQVLSLFRGPEPVAQIAVDEEAPLEVKYEPSPICLKKKKLAFATSLTSCTLLDFEALSRYDIQLQDNITSLFIDRPLYVGTSSGKVHTFSDQGVQLDTTVVDEDSVVEDLYVDAKQKIYLLGRKKFQKIQIGKRDVYPQWDLGVDGRIDRLWVNDGAVFVFMNKTLFLIDRYKKSVSKMAVDSGEFIAAIQGEVVFFRSSGKIVLFNYKTQEPLRQIPITGTGKLTGAIGVRGGELFVATIFALHKFQWPARRQGPETTA